MHFLNVNKLCVIKNNGNVKGSKEDREQTFLEVVNFQRKGIIFLKVTQIAKKKHSFLCLTLSLF